MAEVAKHTLGPWIVEVNEKAASVTVLGRRIDTQHNRPSDGRGSIVTVQCALEPDAVMFSPMCQEQVANAHLIAAAPEMLAALKDARQTIIGLKNSRWSEVEGTDQDWVADIDAAIAKASA